MKTCMLIFFCIGTLSVIQAQNNDLVGTWNLVEFATYSDSGSDIMNEKQLNRHASVWDLFIMEDGTFKQTSNMSGSGTMDTQEGTWETSDNILSIKLIMDGRENGLEYTYELKENTLILSRGNPKGTMKIVATFRKK